MSIKVGVYVDAENVKYNGGYHLRYDVLRKFAARDGGDLLRLNAYVAFDQFRAQEDSEYAQKAYAFQNSLRGFGWKVVTKNVKRYADEYGNVSTKANSDLDLAIDAMLQADNLDQVLLLSGDGDFLQLVTALQNKGCRVELMGFNNVSGELQRQVDSYHSGFLVPDLVPISYEPRNEWGEPGSCVRGYCSKWFDDKGYGFLSFQKRVGPNLWVTDHRDPNSHWESVFCHVHEVSDEINQEDLGRKDMVLEFYLKESDQIDGGLVAQNVRPVQID